MIDDVPLTVDFRLAEHARDWTEEAMSLRPWRAEFFAAFASEIAGEPSSRPCRVLELGSGPGFLAQVLLASNPELIYAMEQVACRTPSCT